jgi:hypothetical protein
MRSSLAFVVARISIYDFGDRFCPISYLTSSRAARGISAPYLHYIDSIFLPIIKCPTPTVEMQQYTSAQALWFQVEGEDEDDVLPV